MVTALPPRIMDYRVSASSPTGELLTLGSILEEAGAYASTSSDRSRRAFSRRCDAKFRRVASELRSRNCTAAADDVCTATAADLRTLSVGDLYRLFRGRTQRRNRRAAEGREPLTCWPESDILAELRSRKAADRDEQLKIDCCTIAHSNELENLSTLLALPPEASGESLPTVPDRDCPPGELLSIIERCAEFRSVRSRETLVRAADLALDLLGPDFGSDSASDSASASASVPASFSADPTRLELLAAIADLRLRRIITIPAWVDTALERTVTAALRDPGFDQLSLALPLLTLRLLNNDRSLERKAQRIINRCYKSASHSSAPTSERIVNLHTAVTCCDYVTRFSARKAASLWNDIAHTGLTAPLSLTPKQIFQLLEVANELRQFAPISTDAQEKLRQKLMQMAESGSIQAKACHKLTQPTP